MNKKLPGTQTFALASLMRLTDFPHRARMPLDIQQLVSTLLFPHLSCGRLTTQTNSSTESKGDKGAGAQSFDVEAMEVLNKVIAATDPKLIGDATAPLFN